MQTRELHLLHDPLAWRAAERPGRPALEHGDRVLTYGELWRAVVGLAHRYREAGLRRGDRVLVLLDNSPEVAVAAYAASLAGGVFCVVNPRTPPPKLAFLLADSGARLAVTDPWRAGTVAEAVAASPSSPAILELDPDRTAAFARHDTPPVPCPAIPNDLAALIYTSGSTGRPKGVMMAHRNMTFAAGSIAQYLRLDASHRILCGLPMSFDYGLYQVLMSVLVGATVIVEREMRFPGKLLERLRESGATVLPAVPTTFATLVQLHERRPLRFPEVRRVTNTAAALPVAHVAALREIFPEALLFKMYGLTECKRVSYLEPELVDARPASVGKAIPGTEVRVLDEEGDETPPGVPGILHVRGPHVMPGYWQRPEETAAMLRPGPLPGERMLRTGDWFVRDEEGFLYFRGRSDDIIKTRGQKVSPGEIEDVLAAIPGVAAAVVLGVPDPVLGEAIRAFVEPAADGEVTRASVMRVCRRRLEGDHLPRDVVVTELPVTANGKVDRRALAAWAAEG